MFFDVRSLYALTPKSGSRQLPPVKGIRELRFKDVANQDVDVVCVYSANLAEYSEFVYPTAELLFF